MNFSIGKHHGLQRQQRLETMDRAKADTKRDAVLRFDQRVRRGQIGKVEGPGIGMDFDLDDLLRLDLVPCEQSCQGIDRRMDVAAAGIGLEVGSVYAGRSAKSCRDALCCKQLGVVEDVQRTGEAGLG